jgi:hypothetical protein
MERMLFLGADDNSVLTSKQSKIHESRHKQVTAIVMMGVIGAEFGASLEDESADKSVTAEGFGLTNYAHARHTSRYYQYFSVDLIIRALPMLKLGIFIVALIVCNGAISERLHWLDYNQRRIMNTEHFTKV